jgi:hypothetical protein
MLEMGLKSSLKYQHCKPILFPARFALNRYKPHCPNGDMTIAAAYLCSDGVVLGADSASTNLMPALPNTPPTSLILNHTQKVFEIGPPYQSPFALCTWGDGMVGGTTSHRTIVARLSDLIQPGITTQAVAEHLRDLVQQAANGAGGPMGFYLAGTDPANHNPRLFLLEFNNGICTTIAAQTRIGPYLSGIPNIFNRLMIGFDDSLPTTLRENLRVGLGNPANFDQVFDVAFANTASRLPLSGQPNLPMREAIDFVHTSIYTTVKFFKFSLGIHFCGGPAEVGFVSTDRPFRWVTHKEFDSAITEYDGGRYE